MFGLGSVFHIINRLFFKTREQSIHALMKNRHTQGVLKHTLIKIYIKLPVDLSCDQRAFSVREYPFKAIGGKHFFAESEATVLPAIHGQYCLGEPHSSSDPIQPLHVAATVKATESCRVKSVISLDAHSHSPLRYSNLCGK